LISFGSNLGDRDRLIAQAASLIAASSYVDALRTSRLFETPPIGGPHGQEPFLNAVAAFETRASARQILELLQHVEQQLGRQRRRRWDARLIDLDVVLHGELVGGGTGLIVPHPRYTARQFVLQPACDVAPDYRDPRFGWSLKKLANHLQHGVPSLALVGGSEVTRNELCQRLREQYGSLTFADMPAVEPMSIVGRAPLVSAPRPRASSEVCDLFEQTHHCDRGWVSAFVPPLPDADNADTNDNHLPRLIARIQSTTAATRWPAPHQMWPSGWQWPEYRLEIDNMAWAVSEVASALDSMRCPVRPITSDGNWW
jgi:2-amino-4-hydroxy-6-hydroxymethyldihydropteridine diphosphokinase